MSTHPQPDGLQPIDPQPMLDRSATLHTEFGHLILQDPEHPDLAPGRRAGLEPDTVGLAGTGMVQLFCLGELPEPHVQVRLWPGPPTEQLLTDTADDAGERTDFVATLEARSTLLVLGSPTGAPTDIPIPLPHPGRYIVRASRRAGQPYPSRTHPDLEITPEQWLVELWPA